MLLIFHDTFTYFLILQKHIGYNTIYYNEKDKKEKEKRDNEKLLNSRADLLRTCIYMYL